MQDSEQNGQVLVENLDGWSLPKLFVALLFVLVVGALGTVAVFWWQISETEKAVATQELYEKAGSPEQKLTIAQNHLTSPISLVWLLDLGNTYYLQQKYDDSARTYALAVKMHRSNPLVVGALLGEAQALAEQKKYTEATALFKEIVQQKLKSPYQPLAALALARLLLQQNNPKEARQTLEQLEVQDPQGAFADEARHLLITIAAN